MYIHQATFKGSLGIIAAPVLSIRFAIHVQPRLDWGRDAHGGEWEMWGPYLDHDAKLGRHGFSKAFTQSTARELSG